MCWQIEAEGGGGKGVEYEILSGDLEGVLEFESLGWVGMGKGELCVKNSSWVELDEGNQYSFEVIGRSVLFDRIASTNFSFTLLPHPSPLTRQSSTSCDPSLWNFSPSSVYGIQTFPSGLTILPPSLRSYPLVINAKALSPCSQIGMSKDILAPSSIVWRFDEAIPEGLVGQNPNDWANGTQMVVPTELLLDRGAFPPNVVVNLKVVADFGGGIVYDAELGVKFLPSPVELIVQSEFSSVFVADEVLLIDFSDSYTLDGFVVGGEGLDWEWNWGCMIPGERGEEGRACVYRDNGAVVMPGMNQAMFEAEGGRGFEEGVPLFFFVQARVKQNGEVVAEGRWSGVMNPVREGGRNLKLVEDFWTCPGSSVGYMVFFLFLLFTPE